MSISYTRVAAKVKATLAKRGRGDIHLLLYDTATTPDASKPWRQTASLTPSKDFTLKGLALDVKHDAYEKDVYVPPPASEPTVQFDQRWIVQVGTERFSIVGQPQRIDPDGSTNILWVIHCRGWAKSFGTV